jgi:hypothetical protein
MNVSCSAEPCPVILDCPCVFYTGANLIYTGIVTNDNLCTALQKIDAKFRDAGLGYVFQNGIIQTSPGQPVKLGGTLIQDTTINSGLYTFTLTGTIESSAFITSGGTSSQFVKGDGSLDSTSYQPTGNYITALTGDGTASGPGSAAFTLANTGVIANTYGSSSKVPVITVDSKGRITNAVDVSINYPAQLVLLSGDATGSGYTGTSIPLTLATVNSNVYTSNTALKFAVNGKGLITSAAPLNGTDINTALGYVPVPEAPFTGITYGRKNGAWVAVTSGSGTVTSVGVTAGTGISASVANPTTTPVITITNTLPDQIVALSAGTGISISGTYPNFTITATGGSTPSFQDVINVGNTLNQSAGNYTYQMFDNAGNSNFVSPNQITFYDPTYNNTSTLTYSSLNFTDFTTLNQTTYGNNFIQLLNYYTNQFVIDNTGSEPIITANQSYFKFPTITPISNTYYLPISVNGVVASSTGDITIPVGTGTVTSVQLSAGTGISLSGTNPITSSGTITVTNSAPDQTVVLSNGTGISVTGTYPNFTITNTSPSSGGTVTGSGTLNYVPKWSSSTALTDSSIFDNGTSVGVGTASPSASYKLDVSGGGKFSGTTNINDLVFLSSSTSGYVELRSSTESKKFLLGNGPSGIADFVAYDGNYMRFQYQSPTAVAVPSKLVSGETQLTWSSGTNSHTLFTAAPSVNTSGGTNAIRGFYFAPSETSTTGVTYTAFQSTKGDVIFGNLATGGADEMVTVDTSGKLKKQAIPTVPSVGFEMNFLLMGA